MTSFNLLKKKTEDKKAKDSKSAELDVTSKQQNNASLLKSQLSPSQQQQQDSLIDQVGK